MKKIVIMLTLMVIALLNAQTLTNNPANVNPFAFFGRQPSAQAEALGQTGVTYQSWTNPAADFNHAVNASYTFATPYSYWYDTDYHFAAISSPIIPDLKLGIAYMNVSYDDVVYNDSDVGEYVDYKSISKISASYQLKNNFIAGINLNYIYNWSNYELNITNPLNPTGTGESIKLSEEAWSADFGVLQKFSLPGCANQQIILAASCQNAIATKLDYSISDYEEELPVILRAGGSWLYDHATNDRFDFALQFHYQYQRLLNSSMREKNSFGLECTLQKLLSLRGGYYNEVGSGHVYQIDHFTSYELTYGAGLVLDFSSLLPVANLPITVKIDYAHYPLTEEEDSNYYKGNTATDSFTISAAYDLK